MFYESHQKKRMSESVEYPVAISVRCECACEVEKRGVAWHVADAAHISTRSTLMPHCSVASSRICCMLLLVASRSDRISESVFVPSTLRRVVCASSFVLWCAFCVRHAHTSMTLISSRDEHRRSSYE